MSEAILNFHDAVILSVTFQSLCFVILILLAKRERHISDWFLCGFFLAQAAIPVHLIINYSEMVREPAMMFSPDLFHLFETAYWIEGPLLLWYTRSLLYREFELHRSDVIFLVPVLFFVTYISMTFYSLSEDAKIVYLNSFPDLEAPSTRHLLQLTRETIFVVFGFACINEISKAQKHAHERYANVKRIDFFWLGVLVAGVMLARTWTLLVTTISFFKPKLGPEVFNALGLMSNYLIFAVINILMFFSLTRSSQMAGKAIHNLDGNSKNPLLLSIEFKEKIENHMRMNRPYKSHFFSIEVLANQLEVNPSDLSPAIKGHFGKNFSEYVNGYRVNEAKRLLADADNAERPMLDILNQVGFDSSATFQAFFKRIVGMSPTQFRKSSLED